MHRNTPSLSLAALVLLLTAGSVAALERIQVMALFKDRAVVNIDGRQRTLEPGKPTPEGVVLIEADAKGAVVEIDGERRTLTLGDRISSRFTTPRDRDTTVHVAPDGHGMYFINGSINGFQVRFLVDTGATHIALNADLARRLGLPYQLEGRRGVTATASGLVESYEVTLERVRVGDIELRNVAATVIDGPYPSEALLGMSFLGQLDMRREGGLLELRRKR